MNDLNETEVERVKRFIYDDATAKAVFKVLQNAFLEPYRSNEDVPLLAASRIALDMLPIAWGRLVDYKSKTKEDKLEKNIGL